jgi:hypothetical protein
MKGIDIADEASGPEPDAQAAGSDSFVVSADLFKYWVIDRDAGTMQIVGQDGKSTTSTWNDEANHDSEIRKIVYDWEKHWIFSITRRGSMVIAEGHVPGRPSRVGDRPVVYLDQNHWRTIADTAVDPARIGNLQEREAAARIIDLASDAGIILPLSSAHLYEAGPLFGDRRYEIGIAMARLSGGWQLRNPVTVWRQEVRAIVADALNVPGECRPQISEPITLEAYALLRESEAAAGGLEEIGRVIGAPSVLVDLLIDPTPDVRPTLGRWTTHHQAISDQFSRFAGSKEDRRRAALRRFWNENISWVRDAARELRHPSTDLPMLSDSELRRAIVAMPMLSHLSALFVGRFLDSNLRWHESDLTDMAFLACAAGHADYVAAEARTGAQLQQIQRSLGKRPSVFTKLAPLVERLTEDRVCTASEKLK